MGEERLLGSREPKRSGRFVLEANVYRHMQVDLAGDQHLWISKCSDTRHGGRL